MPTNRRKTVRTGWKKLQGSGGLTHEQQFLMTALWRDVNNMPPLTNHNSAFKRAHPERFEKLKDVWKIQRLKAHIAELEARLQEKEAQVRV